MFTDTAELANPCPRKPCELAARPSRNLAGEIGEEWEARSGKGEAVDDLLALVQQIVPYHMGHNAETDAVDLLLEVRARHQDCCVVIHLAMSSADWVGTAYCAQLTVCLAAVSAWPAIPTLRRPHEWRCSHKLRLAFPLKAVGK